MIDESSTDSAAMRSTFFINPDGIVCASTCYPHNVGRSVDEMLRLVAALQAVSDGNALAPEGWVSGEELLAVPASLANEIEDDPQWFCRKLERS